jgi:hypothetical protein
MKIIVKVVIGIVAFVIFLGIVGAIVYFSTPIASPNIAISYSCFSSSSINEPTYVEVSMTIHNNGYTDGFNTNPSLFYLTVNNTVYYEANPNSPMPYPIHTSWNTLNIKNGGTYSGTLVFQCSSFATPPFTLGHYDLFGNYNIVWTNSP